MPARVCACVRASACSIGHAGTRARGAPSWTTPNQGRCAPAPAPAPVTVTVATAGFHDLGCFCPTLRNSNASAHQPYGTFELRLRLGRHVWREHVQVPACHTTCRVIEHSGKSTPGGGNVLVSTPLARLHVPRSHVRGGASHAQMGKRNRIDRHSWVVGRLLKGTSSPRSLAPSRGAACGNGLRLRAPPRRT